MLVAVPSPFDAGRPSASARPWRAAAGLLWVAALCAAVATPLAAQRASSAHKKRPAASASAKAGASTRKGSTAKAKASTAKAGKTSAARSATARPSARPAAATAAAAAGHDSVLRAFQVDTVAEPIPETLAPRYPRELRAREVRGSVIAEFVVDTAGRVEPGTFQVISSDDPAFTASVRELLPRARFLPAINEGRLVRQIVRQTFVFDLDVLQRPKAAGTTP